MRTYSESRRPAISRYFKKSLYCRVQSASDLLQKPGDINNLQPVLVRAFLGGFCEERIEVGADMGAFPPLTHYLNAGTAEFFGELKNLIQRILVK